MPLNPRDPRIYMAAERTFLAWIRTGLALMGFGFVVARFGLFLREMGAAVAVPLRTTGFSRWTGTALVLAGVAINIVAALEHKRVIRHLNEDRDITGKPSTTGLVLATLLALVGFGMVAYLFLLQ